MSAETRQLAALTAAEEAVSVPCNGCTACCHRQLVVLTPEEMDLFPHVFERGLFVLRRRENGDCIYLAEGGCSIHGRAPKVCQEYDCRVEFLNTLPEERLRQVQAGEALAANFKAGHERLHTLPAARRGWRRDAV